jgi:hypothetical protein
MMLTLLAIPIGLPITASSLVTATVHCSVRLDPMRDVSLFFLRVSETFGSASELLLFPQG